MDRIKDAYRSRPAIFASFQDVLREHGQLFIDKAQLIASAQRILDDQPVLLAEFETFMRKYFVPQAVKQKRRPSTPPPSPPATQPLSPTKPAAPEGNGVCDSGGAGNDEVAPEPSSPVASSAAGLSWRCRSCKFDNDTSLSDQSAGCAVCEAPAPPVEALAASAHSSKAVHTSSAVSKSPATDATRDATCPVSSFDLAMDATSPACPEAQPTQPPAPLPLLAAPGAPGVPASAFDNSSSAAMFAATDSSPTSPVRASIDVAVTAPAGTTRPASSPSSGLHSASPDPSLAVMGASPLSPPPQADDAEEKEEAPLNPPGLEYDDSDQALPHQPSPPQIASDHCTLPPSPPSSPPASLGKAALSALPAAAQQGEAEAEQAARVHQPEAGGGDSSLALLDVSSSSQPADAQMSSALVDQAARDCLLPLSSKRLDLEEALPAYRPVLKRIGSAESLLAGLRGQLVQSRALASPPPPLHDNSQRDLVSYQQLCTEVAQQLQLSAPLQLACSSAMHALDGAKADIAALLQQQSDRNAVLIATLTRTTTNFAAPQANRERAADQPLPIADDESSGEQQDEGVAKLGGQADCCPLCDDRLCDAVVQPCCHQSCCVACAQDLKKKKRGCPRCNRRVRAVIAIRQ